MSNKYSTFEREVAKFVSSFPKLKALIKKVYLWLNYVLYKKDYKSKTPYRIQKISYDNEESFFGYYDNSPINVDNSYIVFHSVNFSTKSLPNSKKAISIVLYNVRNKEYKVIDKTYSYNWQQGAKLMWLDNNRFIFNIFDNKSSTYKSKIYDILNKSSRIVDMPIYDACSTFGISLNFERLRVDGGDYAYSNRKNTIDWHDNSDALLYVDLVSGKRTKIISLEDVINFNFKNSMNNAKHTFNHVMISPLNNKIMFMHRWYSQGNKRFETLYVCDVDGENLRIIADDGMVSHCCWKSNNEIIAFLRDEKRGDQYYTINVIDSTKVILNEKLKVFGDGHPSFLNDKVLFDTYPNKSRMKGLFILDLKKDKLLTMGDFYESLSYYKQTRCDLHPRFSLDGSKVFFDSVHEGKRGLYIMDI
ncbi:hypothetical protein BA195_09305 [Tenacibaculum soleae]|uniref:Uncharacterized protein n=1 Tax=Tenacibaculum soleae TaxID=447689 RepID=A0A1B9XZU5_9FLAO|nr:hypothetical protein [Tenacibaculum soleae]OCK43074.1 hypothetical protein BA195_09305 [Tenacibaculum soleae]